VPDSVPDVVVALIPGLPLLAALVNGTLALLPLRYPARLASRLAWGSILLSLVGSCWALLEVLSDPTPREVRIYTWLPSGDLEVGFGFLVDPLSAVMMLVVTAISFLIARFSVNYMHNEQGFARYFTVTPLFVFAMLVLVMADNYVLLFLGWESDGVCSYVLISFFQDPTAAGQAGTKAFFMNRVGDAAFLLGIFLIIDTFGTADYAGVFQRADDIGTGTATAIGLLLLVGATGKSAQMPLATWLARAMEGPTPSSALIHAATMVTAGVYLIARSHELYAQAPNALLAVAIVGAATAVLGAVVGLVQTDIKGLLAYSTTAQLGLMFLACGLGAYAVAIFHLAAHAVFKTLLFLTAPSVLHHLHPVKAEGAPATTTRAAPLASSVFLIGALGLVVFPFLSGWWQSEVLGGRFAPSTYLLLGIGGLAAFSAAFSTARLVRIVFAGRTHAESEKQSGVGPARLLMPFAALAALVGIGLVLGLLPGGLEGSWFERFLDPVVAASAGLPAGSPVLAAGLMVALILFVASGWITPLYLDRFTGEAQPLGATRLYNLALHRLWLDDIYGAVLVRPTLRLGRLLERFDDRLVAFTAGPPASPSVVHRPAPSGAVQAATPPVGPTGAAGAVAWVLGSVSGAFARVERDVIHRASGGMAGRLVEALAGVTGWIETAFVGRGERLLDRLAQAVAQVSDTVERRLFQQGVHLDVPRMGGVVGRALIGMEQRLGSPVVIGSILVVWVLAVLAGVVWS